MHTLSRAAALLLLAAPLSAGAGQASLEPVRDNTLFEDPSGALASGAGDFVVAGNTGQGLARRALLAFDLAGSVPAGATITSAALTLTLRQTSAGPHAVALHRASADWGEGASVASGGSGAPAAAGDATWLHTFHPGAFWTSPGGDFAPSLSAAQVVDQAGPYTWSSAALVADVQSMLDAPGSDFGWILIGDETQAQTTKLFASRESTLRAERPVLAVGYSLPAVTYCTAGTSGGGCQALIAASGTSSASAAAGFVLSATGAPGARDGLFFFGTSGRKASPWGNGSSLRCVAPPVRRTPLQTSNGSAATCLGSFSLDLNAHWSAQPGRNPGPGALVQAQLWFQDGALGTLSDAVEFLVCP